jgi:hypothetical protein
MIPTRASNGLQRLLRWARRLSAPSRSRDDATSPDAALPEAPLPRLYSLVPGAEPIELHSYYPHFADYYPKAELQTKRWFVRNVKPDWVGECPGRC